LVTSVLKAAGVVGGLALFVYLLYRGVSGAKRAGGTGSGELLVVLLLGLGTGIAPAPPREVKTESRHLGDKDDSGDPPDGLTTEPAGPTGRKQE
jgi:hypothetical protein